MRRHPVTEIPDDHVPDHPAVLAWTRLGAERRRVERVYVLRERWSASIYRLSGAGRAGSDVIAKRCRSSVAVVERVIYEEILPQLPVTAPRYYGSSDADEGRVWLFLEDVGSERYLESSAEHCAVAGVWLGRMHTSVARADLPIRLRDRLPQGGTRRYLDHLGFARKNIVENLGNPLFEGAEVETLNGIVALHDRLVTLWDRVEEACSDKPLTLVHGDFRPKNAYLRSEPTGLALYPIDWEMAGWGPPAADLARVDLDAYRSVTRELWPDLDERSLRMQAALGQVFRFLAGIAWESPQVSQDTRACLSRPLAGLRVLRGELSNAMRTAGLMDGFEC